MRCRNTLQEKKKVARKAFTAFLKEQHGSSPSFFVCFHQGIKKIKSQMTFPGKDLSFVFTTRQQEILPQNMYTTFPH